MVDNIKRCGMPPIVESEDFSQFVDGKTVAIVGPATTIVGSKQKDKIESFDLVVRMNKALPIPADMEIDTGSRCDLFYHCMSERPEEGGKIDEKVLVDAGVKWFCSPYPEMEIFAKDFVSFREKHANMPIPFHSIGRNLFEWLRDTTGTRPNTGMCLIADLLQSGASGIYVTGFTFFKTQYVKSYRNISDQLMETNANHVTHKQAPQEKWFFKMVKESSVIELDEYLNSMSGLV